MRRKEDQQVLAAESSLAQAGHAAGWHRAFVDGKVWLLSLFWLFQAFGTIGVTLFLPRFSRGSPASPTSP